MPLPMKCTPMRATHAEYESNAAKNNIKEQQRLGKNLQILNQEEKYALRLLELDNKQIIHNFKRLKEKVSKVKTNLTLDEIGNMRELESAGKMKNVYNGITSTNMSRIAAEAKRLNLQKTQRPRTAIPVRQRPMHHDEDFINNKLTKKYGSSSHLDNETGNENKHTQPRCGLLRNETVMQAFSGPHESHNKTDKERSIVYSPRPTILRPKSALVLSKQSAAQKVSSEALREKFEKTRQIAVKTSPRPNHVNTRNVATETGKIDSLNDTYVIQTNNNLNQQGNMNKAADTSDSDDDTSVVFEPTEQKIRFDIPPPSITDVLGLTYNIPDNDDQLFKRVTHLSEESPYIGKPINIPQNKNKAVAINSVTSNKEDKDIIRETSERQQSSSRKVDNSTRDSNRSGIPVKKETPKRQLPKRPVTVSKTFVDERARQYISPNNGTQKTKTGDEQKSRESRIPLSRPKTASASKEKGYVEKEKGYAEIHMGNESEKSSIQKNRRIWSPEEHNKGVARRPRQLPNMTLTEDKSSTRKALRPSTAHQRIDINYAVEETSVSTEEETPRLLNRPQTNKPTVPSRPILNFDAKPTITNNTFTFPQENETFPALPQPTERNSPRSSNVIEIPTADSSKIPIKAVQENETKKSSLPRPKTASSKNNMKITSPRYCKNSSDDVLYTHPPLPGQTGNVPKNTTNSNDRPKTARHASLTHELSVFDKTASKPPTGNSRVLRRPSTGRLSANFGSALAVNGNIGKTNKMVPGKFIECVGNSVINGDTQNVNSGNVLAPKSSASVPQSAPSLTNGEKMIQKISRMLPTPTTTRRIPVRKPIVQIKEPEIETESTAKSSKVSSYPRPMMAKRMYTMVDELDRNRTKTPSNHIEQPTDEDSNNNSEKTNSVNNEHVEAKVIIRDNQSKSRLSSQMDIVKKIAPNCFNMYNERRNTSKPRRILPCTPVGKQNEPTSELESQFDHLLEDSFANESYQQKEQQKLCPKTAKPSGHMDIEDEDRTMQTRPLSAIIGRRREHDSTYESPRPREDAIDGTSPNTEKTQHVQFEERKSSIPVKTRRVLPQPPNLTQNGTRADSSLRQQRLKRHDAIDLETADVYFQRPMSASAERAHASANGQLKRHAIPKRTETKPFDSRKPSRRPFSSHAALEKEEREKKKELESPGRSHSRQRGSVGDSLGIIPIDDDEDELIDVLLDEEKANQSEIDGRLGDFLHNLNGYMEKTGQAKPEWRGSSNNNLRRHPTSANLKFSAGNSKQSAIADPATYFKDRRKSKLLHNKEAFERRRKPEDEEKRVWNEIDKCQYLRVPNDMADYEVNTLATNQIQHMKMLKGLD